METEIKKKESLIPVILVAAAVLLLFSVGGILLFFGGNTGREIKKQLDLGYRYQSEADYDKATVAFRDAVKIDPENKEALELFHDCYRKWMEYDPEHADEIREKEFNTLNALLTEGASEPIEQLLMELESQLE